MLRARCSSGGGFPIAQAPLAPIVQLFLGSILGGGTGGSPKQSFSFAGPKAPLAKGQSFAKAKPHFGGAAKQHFAKQSKAKLCPLGQAQLRSNKPQALGSAQAQGL